MSKEDEKRIREKLSKVQNKLEQEGFFDQSAVNALPEYMKWIFITICLIAIIIVVCVFFI